ncbi:hypothetical protein EDB89DRAFT_2064237 [Lactarius sanguifluus]|nr:hypothetical protein EDB89DRAFT_2064237 [Lactarius sanguifluus]
MPYLSHRPPAIHLPALDACLYPRLINSSMRCHRRVSWLSSTIPPSSARVPTRSQPSRHRLSAPLSSQPSRHHLLTFPPSPTIPPSSARVPTLPNHPAIVCLPSPTIPPTILPSSAHVPTLPNHPAIICPHPHPPTSLLVLDHPAIIRPRPRLFPTVPPSSVCIIVLPTIPPSSARIPTLPNHPAIIHPHPHSSGRHPPTSPQCHSSLIISYLITCVHVYSFIN